MKRLRANYYVVLALRMVLLHAVFMLCRVAFAVHNWDAIAPLPWRDVPSVVRGGFIFDTASIIYVNALFLVCSLIPSRARERVGYQRFLMWLFVGLNSLALIVNVADIYYFPFKLSRIASDDLHFFGESNIWSLFGTFMVDFWQGPLLWALLTALLWLGFRWLRYTPRRNSARLRTAAFVPLQLVILAAVATYGVFATRGFSFSPASFPLTMSDASLFVKPRYATLVLSNPFCLIRTLGHRVSHPRYFDEAQLDALYPVEHFPVESPRVFIEGRPNVVIIALESFGSAHLKSFSDRFADDDPGFTPFLDSLARESYICTNAYQNGLRSIDAMPAIWASIPSFQSQFLSLPNSIAPFKAMPACLAEIGYRTMFFHGSVRESMGIVAFGQAAGVEHFFSREDYEAQHGGGDFDGKWGIWDHKFLPYAAQKLKLAPEPFMATIFTLSSHHPYLLPPGYEGRFREGALPIQRVIAYSDHALGEFFRAARKESWYANTLFVLTADHGSGADNEKFRQMPYAYAVPIIFHYPGAHLKADASALAPQDRGELARGLLKGERATTSQHINLMPTILRMVGYNKPFFAFGRDMFNDADADFAINYYGSAFNFMTDSMRYVFNERELSGVFRYRDDYMSQHEITALQPSDSANIVRMKAFVQQYSRSLRERRFTVRERE